jgi:hypothetical protein
MVSYTVLPQSIVVGLTGKRYAIKKEDIRYERVLKLIQDFESKNEEIPEEEMKKVCDPVAIFGEEPGVELKDGLIYIDGEGLPSELSVRVLDLKRQNIPVKSLLAFWRNLKENPSMNSVQQLYKEHNGHPITSDGYFIAYRSVTEDFKDHHTKTMDNSVGKTVSIPRNKVNDKPEETCSTGLHVASWSYAKDFGGARRMIEVKVNPKNVVCVPNDYNNTKMRVCEFEVLSEIAEEHRTTFIDNSESSSDDDSCCDRFDCDECENCGCEDCICDVDSDYSEEDRTKVLELAKKYEDRYEGDALTKRIGEDCDLDDETIDQILEDN